MGGSDAGDDEEDAAMAAVTTEKMESDEDSDQGSDHSGMKRKSLAMKVSVGAEVGTEGCPGQGSLLERGWRSHRNDLILEQLCCGTG